MSLEHSVGRFREPRIKNDRQFDEREKISYLYLNPETVSRVGDAYIPHAEQLVDGPVELYPVPNDGVLPDSPPAGHDNVITNYPLIFKTPEHATKWQNVTFFWIKPTVNNGTPSFSLDKYYRPEILPET